MPLKNWVYRADRPTELADAVDEAIFQGHRYRNDLVRLELDKRSRHQDLMCRLVPEYVSAECRVRQAERWLALARETIQEERCRQRTKRPKNVSIYTKAAKCIVESLKDRRATRKESKQQSYERADVKSAMDENSELHKAGIKALRAESTLYWGTRGIIDRSAASFRSGAPPRFSRFEGEGKVAVQIQKGRDCRFATEADTVFQVIVPSHVERLHWEKRKVRGLKNRAEVLIRIGSDGRDPVLARVPIRMHRALPEGKIKWAVLEKRIIGSHVEWYLRIEINCPDLEQRDPGSWVALHVGWRREGDRIHAVTWEGSDGERGEHHIDAKSIRQYMRLDEIRSSRDRRFSVVRDRLARWIDAREKLDQPVPEWLTDLRQHMRKWRSPARLHKLANVWRSERFHGDEIAFRWLHGLQDKPFSGWRKKDKRLYDEHAFTSRKLRRRRRDNYRCLAKQLSERYGVLITADVAVKELNENSDPEELTADNHWVHRMSKIAAVSELVGFCKERFGVLHSVKVSSVNLRRLCHRCGHVNRASSITTNGRVIQCADCGWTGSTLGNATANQLARGEAAIRSGALLELVTAKEDRDRKAAEKLSKMQEGNRAARKRHRNHRETQDVT